MTDKTPRGRCITTDGYRTWPERGTKTPPSPARAGVQEAQADMNESMQRRLDRIASEIPWLKHSLVEDLEGFCPKCGAPKHVGECPGSMKAAREFNQPVMDAISELKAENARLRARLERGIGFDDELTRLRRQNRRLRRKLRQERGAWDRALEAAARIAEAGPMGAAAAKAIRAGKIWGEE